MNRNLLFFLIFPSVFLSANLSLFAQKDTLYFTVRQGASGNLIGRDTDIKGLYRGSYKDTIWQHIGWKNNIIWSVAVDTLSQSKNIFLGCLNGVMRSTDFGKTWKVVTDWRVSDALKVAIDPKNPKIIYASTPTGIFKSVDWGESWKSINKGLKPTNQTFISCLLMDNKDSQTLFAGTASGVVWSKNGGKKWQTLGLGNIEIHDIVKSSCNNDELLCATENKGIFQSLDRGNTWQPMSQSLRSTTIYTIASHPQNQQVIYCGGHQSGIYKSEDSGKSWQPLTNILSGKSIHKIIVLPQPPYTIFAACLDGGLYRSEDRGQTFSCVGECNGQIWDIFVDSKR